MDNLKVAHKLLLLNIVAFIGMLIVGLLGYMSIQSAKEAVDKMFNENLMSIYYIGDSRYATRFAQVQTCLAPLTTDDTLYQARRQKFDSALKEMDDDIANYEKIIADKPEFMSNLNSIKSEWNNIKTNSTQLMNMRPSSNIVNDPVAMSNHLKEAMEFYEKKVMPDFVAIGGNLAKIQQAAHEEAIEVLNKNDEAIGSTVRSIIIGCVVIFIILIAVSYKITSAVTEPLYHLLRVFDKLTNGDFREGKENHSTRRDEFGEMNEKLAIVRKVMNQLIKKTSVSSEQIAASSEELTASARQSAQASEQVANSVTSSAGAVIEQQQFVSEAMEAIEHALMSIESMNKVANTVAEHAENSNTQAEEGSGAVESAINQILSVEQIVNQSAGTVDKLGQRSNEIGKIVETISAIAEQTNLLALNAAIEAARAGEHGRGFAVVADEVRKLAEESKGAAERISTLIDAIQSDTDDAVKSMHEGSLAVREGTKSVEQLRTTFDHIREASSNVSNDANSMVSELKAVMEDTIKIKTRSEKISENGAKVSKEMESVSAASEEQSASAEEIASASDSLANLAQDLQGQLQRFKY